MGILKKETVDGKIKCRINSSNLMESVFDPAKKELILTFKGGRRYQYHGVTDKIYESFETADSQGKFFHSNIKPLSNTRLDDILKESK